MLSVEAARSADAIGELVDGVSQEQAWAKPFLRYHEERFYRYYADLDALFCDIVRSVCGDEAARHVIVAAEMFRRIRSWPPGRLRRLLAKVPEHDLRRTVKYGRRVVRLILRKQLDSIATDVEEIDLDWHRLVSEPAIQYLFQCVVPCYLHFGTTPQDLFARAVEADRPDLGRSVAPLKSAYESDHVVCRADFNDEHGAEMHVVESDYSMYRIRHEATSFNVGRGDVRIRIYDWRYNRKLWTV